MSEMYDGGLTSDQLREEIRELTRKNNQLREGILALLEYWDEDDMDQEYYDLAESKARAALAL